MSEPSGSTTAARSSREAVIPAGARRTRLSRRELLITSVRAAHGAAFAGGGAGAATTLDGVKLFGPALRSLDVFPLTIGDGGRLIIDTGKTVTGTTKTRGAACCRPHGRRLLR